MTLEKMKNIQTVLSHFHRPHTAARAVRLISNWVSLGILRKFTEISLQSCSITIVALSKASKVGCSRKLFKALLVHTFANSIRRMLSDPTTPKTGHRKM